MSEVDPGTLHMDVAGYVLGVLSADDRQAFERHLAGCSSCQREMEQLRRLPRLLDEAAPLEEGDVEVPDGLEARVLGKIARAAAGRGDPPPVLHPISRRAGWRQTWAAAAAAALLVAFGGGLALGRMLPAGGQPAATPPRATQTVHLVATGGGPGSGTATVRKSRGETNIVLTVRNLPQPSPGHVYTCWLVAADDTPQHQDRVSVGSFTTSGAGPVTLRWDTAADLVRFPNMGVTLEPQNGNPARQGPKVLAATQPV